MSNRMYRLRFVCSVSSVIGCHKLFRTFHVVSQYLWLTAADACHLFRSFHHDFCIGSEEDAEMQPTADRQDLKHGIRLAELIAS
jgi:hypothetical protein